MAPDLAPIWVMELALTQALALEWEHGPVRPVAARQEPPALQRLSNGCLERCSRVAFEIIISANSRFYPNDSNGVGHLLMPNRG